MKLDIENGMAMFESNHNLIIPDDLKHYFRTFKVEDYDLDMFFFYGLDKFKSVVDEVGNWKAAPDYREIVNTLPAHENCFVFAEYFCHIYVYAIRLNENISEQNEVYVILGDVFKVVAKSFKEFLEIYFSEQWDEIFI